MSPLIGLYRWLSGRRPARRHPIRRPRLELERLEDRTVPSTILWTNRGQASDGFDRVFGPQGQADQARKVVDAAILAWQRTINSFNYAPTGGPVDTFLLKVQMKPLPAPTGFQFSWDFNGNNQIDSAAGQFNPPEVDASGKPHTGVLTLADDPAQAGSQGWFIDQSPLDSDEFMGPILNAFAGTAQPGSPAQGREDLFSCVVAGLSHLLGLGTTAAFPNSPELHLQTGGFLQNTHQPDTALLGGQQVGNLWTFTGPSVTALFTDDLPSTVGVFKAINVARPPNTFTNSSGTVFSGAVDASNDTIPDSTRLFPSNLDALMLHDAYGYTITPPETFGTFYALLNPVNGVLTVRGAGDLNSNYIRLYQSGNDLVASVDLYDDVPGTGPTDAFESHFALGNVHSINIQTTGSYVASIKLDSTGISDAVSIDTGTTAYAFIWLSPTDGNLDNIVATSLDIKGGRGGYNRLFLDDRNKTAAADYTINDTSIQGLAHAKLTYQGMSYVELRASSSDTTITIGPTTADNLAVYGDGGWDTVTVLSPPGGVSRWLQVYGQGNHVTLRSPSGPNQWYLNGGDSGSGRLYSSNDIAAFTGINSLVGGASNDRFIFAPGAGIGGIDGGAGVTTLDYSAWTTPVRVRLQYGSASGVGGGGLYCVGGSGTFIVMGGSAGDDLEAGDLPTVLVGNAGNDYLIAGNGRDILIGGLGSDWLSGGAADDLFIGGYTDYDNSDVKLAALMATWNSGLAYGTRIASLRQGVNLNAPYELDSKSVHDDYGWADTLNGGAGQDWFFTFKNDKVLYQTANETVDAL